MAWTKLTTLRAENFESFTTVQCAQSRKNRKLGTAFRANLQLGSPSKQNVLAGEMFEHCTCRFRSFALSTNIRDSDESLLDIWLTSALTTPHGDKKQISHTLQKLNWVNLLALCLFNLQLTLILRFLPLSKTWRSKPSFTIITLNNKAKPQFDEQCLRTYGQADPQHPKPPECCGSWSAALQRDHHWALTDYVVYGYPYKAFVFSE